MAELFLTALTFSIIFWVREAYANCSTLQGACSPSNPFLRDARSNLTTSIIALLMTIFLDVLYVYATYFQEANL